MTMSFRTTPRVEHAIAFLAEHDRCSRQEAVERAVLDRFARLEHCGNVVIAADAAWAEWQDVLRRLGRD